MKAARTINLINLPQVDPTHVAFTFTSQTSDGAWAFVFKYVNGTWSGWATLPGGEVRQFGCVPNVIDWTGFLDFGIVLLSSIASLGVADLTKQGTCQLVVIGWA